MLKLLVPQPRLTKSPVRNVVGAKSELFRQDEEGKQADTRLQGSQEKGQTPKHLTAAFIISSFLLLDLSLPTAVPTAESLAMFHCRPAL